MSSRKPPEPSTRRPGRHGLEVTPLHFPPIRVPQHLATELWVYAPPRIRVAYRASLDRFLNPPPQSQLVLVLHRLDHTLVARIRSLDVVRHPLPLFLRQRRQHRQDPPQCHRDIVHVVHRPNCFAGKRHCCSCHCEIAPTSLPRRICFCRYAKRRERHEVLCHSRRESAFAAFAGSISTFGATYPSRSVISISAASFVAKSGCSAFLR